MLRNVAFKECKASEQWDGSFDLERRKVVAGKKAGGVKLPGEERNRVGLNLLDCFQLHAASSEGLVGRMKGRATLDSAGFRLPPSRWLNWTFFYCQFVMEIVAAFVAPHALWTSVWKRRSARMRRFVGRKSGERRH